MNNPALPFAVAVAVFAFVLWAVVFGQDVARDMTDRACVNFGDGCTTQSNPGGREMQ